MCSSCPKLHRSSYQRFLLLSIKIVRMNKFLFITCLSLLQTSIFWSFSQLQILFQSFNTNMKWDMYRKYPNLTVFCKHYFSCYDLGQRNSLKSFELLLVVFLPTELSILRKNKAFFRNTNDYSKWREGKKSQTILELIFMKFTGF